VSKKSEVYQIRVQGYIKPSWSEWLQSFQVKHKRNGITILTGKVSDQSALQGLLDYLFGMGITILSFKRLEIHPFVVFFTHLFLNSIYTY